jgi:UDPglucose--hexose-1-phosphate uridylyltransferase
MRRPDQAWEERWHPLRREWVIVSAHRDTRPWRGETVGGEQRSLPRHDPDCYLCPGNVRISGQRNPDYDGVYVFDNDHPCVGPAAPAALEPAPGIYRNRRADGLSRVVCFTPRHDLTLAELPVAEIANLLRTLQGQYRELAARPEVNHVLMFENKGEVVGVSNPHPHAQIYATNFVFRTIEVEARAFAEYLEGHGTPLFQEIIRTERDDGRRIVVDRASALSFVPYFARYPYETYVAPADTRPSIADLEPAELTTFAAVLKETLVRLDNLWRMSLPYMMVMHQAPTDGGAHPGFHFHVQILTPLRRPGLLKYLAGPEVGGGNFLNDTAPEDKAAELRAVAPVHYRATSDA